MRLLVLLAALSLGAVSAAPAEASDPLGPQALTQIIPGHSTKAELSALLGAPWRIVQFDDCGQAMAGQADETWEYRGTSPDGCLPAACGVRRTRRRPFDRRNP